MGSPDVLFGGHHNAAVPPRKDIGKVRTNKRNAILTNITVYMMIDKNSNVHTDCQNTTVVIDLEKVLVYLKRYFHS